MRKDAAFFAGATIFAAILAFHFWNQDREGRRLTAELRQQLEELKAARNTDSVRAAGRAVVLQNAVVPVAPVAASVQPVAQGGGTANALALISAQKCEAQLAQAKRSAAQTTAQWASEVKLTPAETQMVTEIREALSIASLPCEPSGGSPAKPEQLQAQLEATLGPARFEQLQEFNAIRTTSQNMTTLAAQLVGIGVPLDAEQTRQLTTTILDENRRTRREASSTVAPSDPYARLAYEVETLKLTEERFERTLKSAQSYLRPEQLAQLRGNFARQIESMQTILKQLRTSVEAGQGIPRRNNP